MSLGMHDPLDTPILYELYQYCINNKKAVWLLAKESSSDQNDLDQKSFIRFIQKISSTSSENQISALFQTLCHQQRVEKLRIDSLNDLLIQFEKSFFKARKPDTLLWEIRNRLGQSSAQQIEMLKPFNRTKDNTLDVREFQEFVSSLVADAKNVELLMLSDHCFKARKSLSFFQIKKLINPQSNESGDNPSPLANKPTTPYQEIDQRLLKPMHLGQSANLEELLQNSLQNSNYFEISSHYHPNVNFSQNAELAQDIPGIKFFKTNFSRLQAAGKQYTDPEFPPNKQSLGERFEKLTWQRASEFQPGATMFRPDDTSNRYGIGQWITSNNVKQGVLGDCYFLAALSAVSNRRPDIILKNFITQQINKVGMYCVKFCIDGEWRAIVVDDYFPVMNNQPAFSSGSRNELWVMVIEKAWAKVFGSYLSIEAGHPIEVLRALTGAPTKIIETSNNDCIQRRCIMGCVTEKGDNLKNKGLVPGHAYTVLRIKTISHPVKGQVRLVKLRNPWGREEWKGDWSQTSELWTQELREKAKVDRADADNGAFYIELEEFRQLFKALHICYVGPYMPNQQGVSDCYKSQIVKAPYKGATYFEIQVQADGEYFLTVCQTSQRFSGLQRSELAIVRMILTDSKKNLKESVFQPQAEIWLNPQLKKGEIYYLQVKLLKPQKAETRFNFSIYGNAEARFKVREKVSHFLNDMLLQKAQQLSEFKPYKGASLIKRGFEILMKAGLCYFYIVNDSPNYRLETLIDCQQSLNLKPKKPLSLKFERVVGPKKRDLTVFKITALECWLNQQEIYSTIQL